MPRRTQTICKIPGCGRLTDRGYCKYHAKRAEALRSHDTRDSSSRRGYDAAWRKIRAAVLRKAGIPKERWPEFDVHHSPPYNPAIEPDHRKYHLQAVPRSEHSRITSKTGGGFGNRRQGEGEVKSLRNTPIDREVQVRMSNVSKHERSFDDARRA